MTERTREPYRLEEPDASLGDLVGRIAGDVGVMVRDHIELAKHEITAEAKKAGSGVGLLSGGALAGWIGALMISFAAAWGLALVVDIWLAFLIVGVVWLAIAGLMAMAGRRALQEVDVAPRETIGEVRRDKEWLREQTT